MQENMIENTYQKIRTMIFEEINKGYKNPSSKEIMDGTSMGKSFYEYKVILLIQNLCEEWLEDLE